MIKIYKILISLFLWCVIAPLFIFCIVLQAPFKLFGNLLLKIGNKVAFKYETVGEKNESNKQN